VHFLETPIRSCSKFSFGGSDVCWRWLKRMPFVVGYSALGTNSFHYVGIARSFFVLAFGTDHWRAWEELSEAQSLKGFVKERNGNTVKLTAVCRDSSHSQSNAKSCCPGMDGQLLKCLLNQSRVNLQLKLAVTPKQ